jgi:hypothetical protein
MQPTENQEEVKGNQSEIEVFEDHELERLWWLNVLVDLEALLHVDDDSEDDWDDYEDYGDYGDCDGWESAR